MYSVLVLGLIPGTDIQISFQAWLATITLLPLVVMAVRLLIRSLSAMQRGFESRLPLHASQLHHRLHQTAR